MNEKEDADSRPSHAGDLRREAERRLRDKVATPAQGMAEVDARAVLHKLQVHQIELEMQNEELLCSQVALQEASDKYQDLFDFAPVGYFLLNEQGRILEVNLAGAALLGLERSTAVKQRLAQYVAPRSLARFAEFCCEVLRADSKQACEIELLRGEQRIYALLEGIPARDGDGNRSFRVTVTDITERKRIDDAQTFLLQCGYRDAGEDFFQSVARYLAQSLGMDYVCIDRLLGDGLTAQTVAVYNDGNFDDNVAYTLKDTPCGDVVGKMICCFPEDVCQLFPKDTALQQLKAESYVGTTLWSFDGKPIGLIAIIGRKPLAKPHLAESILKLVAIRAAGELERKRADEALCRSERRYRSFVEVTNQFAWVTDAAGQVVEDIPAFRKFTGQTYEQVKGAGWSAALQPDDLRHTLEAWTRAVSSKTPYEVEYWMRRHDGVYRLLLSRGVPILNEDGSVAEWVGTCIDITARKAAEQTLRQLNKTLEQRVAERTAELHQRAEQLEALAIELTQAEQRERRRLAQVLHDHLQQLLVAARMKVGLLRRRVPDDQLGQTIGQLDDLLNETINESRSLATQLCPPVLYEYGLAAALEWLGRQTHEKYALVVEVEADPAAEPAEETTRAFLFQAVGELLLNAAKHARAQRVRVRMSRTEQQQVQIEVRDDGVGFDPGQWAGKPDRGGFGMFSIRRRLEVLGGEVEVLSSPGQGTRVTLRAPLRTAAAQS